MLIHFFRCLGTFQHSLTQVQINGKTIMKGGTKLEVLDPSFGKFRLSGFQLF